MAGNWLGEGGEEAPVRHTRRLVDIIVRWKNQRMLKAAKQVRRPGHASSTNTQHSWLDKAAVTPPSLSQRPLWDRRVAYAQGRATLGAC